jgi:hypothetical protein
MYHSLPRAFLYSAYQLFAEFSRNGEIKRTQGTAFFVTDGASRIALISNRHSIELPYKDQKYVGYQLTALSIRGYLKDDRFVEGTVELADAKIALPSNSQEDVAAIKLGRIRIAGSVEGPVTPVAIGWEMIAGEAAFESGLGLCDMLAFPGYPSWFDRDGERPIIRCGTVASDPKSSYSWQSGQPKARRMAYEAFSFGGSSGSPVFALPRGIQVSGGLSGGNFRGALLIGVNAGHLADSDDFPTHHSGISYLFKATVISDCLNSLFE